MRARSIELVEFQRWAGKPPLKGQIVLVPRTPCAIHARTSVLASRSAAVIASLLVLTSTLTFVLPPTRAVASPSTSGTEFWIAFLDNATPPDPDALELFVASESATTGTVTGGALPSPITFSVAAGTVTTVSIPVSARSSGNGIQDIGLNVTTNDPVSIYGINRRTSSSDAFTAIPVTGLGTRYRIAAATSTVFTSVYAVVATTDGTTIRIDGGADIALDEGEAYVANINGDASGTLVESSAPVSVLSGHRCSNFKGVNCDHMVEHLPPTSAFGTEFAVVRFANEDSTAARTKDAFKVIADIDGTEVRVDGVVAGTINAGQSLVVEPYGLDGASTLNGGVITTSEPALLVQFMSTGRYRVDGSTTTVGDPSMTLVAPTDQFRSSVLFATMAAGFAYDAANVVIATAAVGSVRLDGAPVAAGSFQQLGSSGYSAAQLRITSGTHSLSADAPFGVTVYGANPSDSYATPGGVGASSVTTPTPPPTTPSLGPVLECEEAARTGEMVTCRIANGDVGIDILWRLRAPDGTTALEGPVTLGPEGRGSIEFTMPRGAPGRYWIELVAWGVETSIDVAARIPTSVPAGGGVRNPSPALLLIVAALVVGVSVMPTLRRSRSATRG